MTDPTSIGTKCIEARFTICTKDVEDNKEYTILQTRYRDSILSQYYIHVTSVPKIKIRLDHPVPSDAAQGIFNPK
jgi:hypothetical protein